MAISKYACKTEDDVCTVKMSGKLKKLMFMRLCSIWIFYQKNLQINRSFFASYGTHFMNIIILLPWGFLSVRDSGHRGNKITEAYLPNGKGGSRQVIL